MSDLHREKTEKSSRSLRVCLKSHTSQNTQLNDLHFSMCPNQDQKSKRFQKNETFLCERFHFTQKKWNIDYESIFHTSLTQRSDIGITWNTLAQCYSTCCKHTTIVSWLCELHASLTDVEHACGFRVGFVWLRRNVDSVTAIHNCAASIPELRGWANAFALAIWVSF